MIAERVHEYDVASDGVIANVRDRLAPIRRIREEAAKARKVNLQRIRDEAGFAPDVLRQLNVPASRLLTELAPTGKQPYQRPLAGKRVEEIALAFTWAAFNPIVVAEHESLPGHYYILDGNHHLHAAMMIYGLRGHGPDPRGACANV